MKEARPHRHGCVVPGWVQLGIGAPGTPARREQRTQDQASWDGSRKQHGQMTNGRERSCPVFGG